MIKKIKCTIYSQFKEKVRNYSFILANFTIYKKQRCPNKFLIFLMKAVGLERKLS